MSSVLEDVTLNMSNRCSAYQGMVKYGTDVCIIMKDFSDLEKTN